MRGRTLLGIAALGACLALPAIAQAHKVNLDAAAEAVADRAAARYDEGRGFRARCTRRIARGARHSHRVGCTYSYKQGRGSSGAKCKGKAKVRFRSPSSRRMKVRLGRPSCVSLNPPG